MHDHINAVLVLACDSSSLTGGNDSTRVSQAIAPPGHYAVNGLLYVCPAGYYGATSGLYTATCSGLCKIPGYYCPSKSVYSLNN